MEGKGEVPWQKIADLIQENVYSQVPRSQIHKNLKRRVFKMTEDQVLPTSLTARIDELIDQDKAEYRLYQREVEHKRLYHRPDLRLVRSLLAERAEKEEKDYPPWRAHPIELVAGLSYVLSKHSNVCSYLTHVLTPEWEKNISVLWSCARTGEENPGTFSLSIPEELYELLRPTGKTKHKCSKRFIIFPIHLRPCESGSSHLGAMIYDQELGTVERFEPNGLIFYATFPVDYHTAELDASLKSLFTSINPKLTYLSPQQVCPYIGPQFVESVESSMGPREVGFCAVWSFAYMDMRLTNPDTPPDVLISSMLQELQARGSLRQFIRAYSHLIFDYATLGVPSLSTTSPAPPSIIPIRATSPAPPSIIASHPSALARGTKRQRASGPEAPVREAQTVPTLSSIPLGFYTPEEKFRSALRARIEPLLAIRPREVVTVYQGTPWGLTWLRSTLLNSLGETKTFALFDLNEVPGDYDEAKEYVEREIAAALATGRDNIFFVGYPARRVRPSSREYERDIFTGMPANKYYVVGNDLVVWWLLSRFLDTLHADDDVLKPGTVLMDQVRILLALMANEWARGESREVDRNAETIAHLINDATAPTAHHLFYGGSRSRVSKHRAVCMTH